MVYYINIGSNLGNRLMNLTRTVAAVEKEFGWFELSHHVESEAWGYDSENKFLNVGMVFISELGPEQVLDRLQAIEHRFSPEPHRNADGSYRDRLVDIDIMAVEGVEMQTERLTLPHPHLNDRPFFLDPYLELRDIMREKITTSGI